MYLYNYQGQKVNSIDERNRLILENTTIDYGYYAGTFYSLTHVNKKRTDGTMQYPFVRYIPGRTTAHELAEAENWGLIFNGGVGTGLGIENSILITDDPDTDTPGTLSLTIDRNGDLSYVEANTAGKGQEYIANGIVSATCGFFPLIENYEDFDYPTDIPGTETPSWQMAQRQIIGQYANGDYAFITSDGRGFNNSLGFTMEEAQALCKTLGLKFAFNLDGGGSTQTVVRRRNMNLIYEGTYGRKRGYFIVFNGTTQFGIPE